MPGPLSTLRRWLRTDAEDATSARHAVPLVESVRQLEVDVAQLQRGELQRAAEHAVMIDQLDRLYKRMAARIARENGAAVQAEDAESVLALRQRLRR